MLDAYNYQWFPMVTRILGISKNMTRLGPHECFSAYETDFLSKYDSLVLITTGFNDTDEPGYSSLQDRVYKLSTQTVWNPSYSTQTPAYSWMCKNYGGYRHSSWSKTCADARPGVDDEDWMVQDEMLNQYKIQYCLAEKTAEKCSLQYSFPLAIVVIVANLAKAILIYLVAYRLRGDPLLTLGDAIASFLRNPDRSMAKSCLLTRQETTRRRIFMVARYFIYKPRPYVAKPKRWWRSPAGARWATFFAA